MNSELFAFLLRDTAYLIRPLPVTTLSIDQLHSPDIDIASHPHLNSVLVLSDLTKLFTASQSDKKITSKPNHITHKLLFYAAHILSTPSPILRRLVEELLEWSSTHQQTVSGDLANESMKPRARAAIIEEV